MTDKGNIIFRQLISTDFEDYKRIRLECLKMFPNNFGTTYQEELISNNYKLKNAIQNADETNFAFGAFTMDKKLIGICGFVNEERQKTKHRGEVIQMYVDPDFSKQGIGKELIKLTIAKAIESAQIEQIVLGVIENNKAAIHLYKEIGFTEYGKLENYFKTEIESFTQCFMKLEK